MLLDQPMRALAQMATTVAWTSKHSESLSCSAAPGPELSDSCSSNSSDSLWSAGSHVGSRGNLSEPIVLLSVHLDGEEKSANYGEGQSASLPADATVIPGPLQGASPGPGAFGCASWRKSPLPLPVCRAPWAWSCNKHPLTMGGRGNGEGRGNHSYIKQFVEHCPCKNCSNL